MKFPVISSSVPLESDVIISRMKNVRTRPIAGKSLYQGTLDGVRVLVLNTGIGKVNASHSVTAVIEKFSISMLLNIGVGGAYPLSGLQPGDLAIAKKETYGDDGVIGPGGWRGMREIGIPLMERGKKKYFNAFPLDKGIVKKASRITHTISSVNRVKAGNFVTVSATTGSHRRALELEKRFEALCENMEGAAIAHVSAIYGIPFIEIRGISNMVGMRDRRRWKLKSAAEICQKAAIEIIKKI